MTDRNGKRPKAAANLLSFEERDHGPRDGSPLKPWVECLLRRHGVELDGGRVRLLCFPRVLGYGFDPISIWYCHHRDGSLRAVLAEVNNTFGEHHFYLMSGDGAVLAWPVTRTVDKVFHVSPLMGMKARYGFRLAEPAERLSVLIRQYEDDKLTLIASQQGQGYPINDRRLISACLRVPLLPFKVMAAIHWQAIKIWLRGTSFFSKFDGSVELCFQDYRHLTGAYDHIVSIEMLEAVGEDYARTLAEWHRLFMNSEKEVAQMDFDARFRRMWRYYLAYCEAGFRCGRVDLAQVLVEHA